MEKFCNAHTHVFTLNHVPDKFGKTLFFGLGGLFTISRLRKRKIFRILLKLLSVLKKSDSDVFDRLVSFIRHGEAYGQDVEKLEQKHIFSNLQGYYPGDTRFIALSMDMEYMNAGPVPETFDRQCLGLEEVRNENPDTFYPFIFADPRRIKQKNEQFNGHANFLEYFTGKLLDNTFSGIKLYPALGYWPFDIELEPVYDLALEMNIPIMAHCSLGPVYYRGPMQYLVHPLAPHLNLPGNRPREYTMHYTNPVNYHMLLDPGIISLYWGKTKNYSRLKICLAHFGGTGEWMKYLQNPWIAAEGNLDNSTDYPSLERRNWNFNKNSSSGEYTWFSVICDLLGKYENMYADISSTLSDDCILPLLKILLIENETLRKKILFGTDFYMVAKDASERELSIKLRSYIGEELFRQIAVENVERFLKRT